MGSILYHKTASQRPQVRTRIINFPGKEILLFSQHVYKTEYYAVVFAVIQL